VRGRHGLNLCWVRDLEGNHRRRDSRKVDESTAHPEAFAGSEPRAREHAAARVNRIPARCAMRPEDGRVTVSGIPLAARISGRNSDATRHLAQLLCASVGPGNGPRRYHKPLAIQRNRDGNLSSNLPKTDAERIVIFEKALRNFRDTTLPSQRLVRHQPAIDYWDVGYEQFDRMLFKEARKNLVSSLISD